MTINIANGYRVVAGENNSWIVEAGDVRPGMIGSVIAFSDHGDLLIWLKEQHRIAARESDGR